MTTATLAPAQVAALDQAIAGWRDACDRFARMTGTGAEMVAAEAAMRAAGRDRAAGLVMIPAGAVRFTDVRGDGARVAAMCGAGDGSVWVCWRGSCLRHGVEARDYSASDLVQVRG